jgi:hypothetical protein
MVRLGSFFGRVKVKNTFVEVENDADDAFVQSDWKQQSEPVLITEKLLGSSFSRILDAKDSDLKLGSASFVRSGSFVAMVPEEADPCEIEPGNESTDIESDGIEGMGRQVTEEFWDQWCELDDFCRQGKEPNEINAVVVAQAPAILLAAAIPTVVIPEEVVEEISADQDETYTAKTRRRRKRDSLIDKAAKEQRQQSSANPMQSASSICSATVKVCSRCKGKCGTTCKFCQYCGAALRCSTS